VNPVIVNVAEVAPTPSIKNSFLTYFFLGEWEWDYAELPGTQEEATLTPGGLPEETQEGTQYTPRDEVSVLTEGFDGVTLDPEADEYQHHSESSYGQDRKLRYGREGREGKDKAKDSGYQTYSSGYISTYDEPNYGPTSNDSSYAQADKGKEIPCPMCNKTFFRSSDLERHHKTVHLNDGERRYQCVVDGCTAHVRSWTTAGGLRWHQKTWHGGDSDTDKAQPQQPLQANSQQDLGVRDISHNIGAKDPGRKDDRLDPSKSYNPCTIHALSGFKGFRVHRSREFEFGKVFKVLWSEPIGAGGTEITVENTPAKYGEKAFHKIRRFVVVQRNYGHSICIPIFTYGYQGVLKYGVHPEDHAVVYSSKTDGPYYRNGEEGLIKMKPIRIDVKNPADKLDKMSRLNFAKVYTVEHNVKVYFIGRVAKNYEQAVVVAFNAAHPPISASPHGYRPDSPVFSHAEGPTPNYPTSSASYSSGAQPYPPSYPTANSDLYYASGEQLYNHPDAYRPQPQILHARKQQQSENQTYDDGYDDAYPARQQQQSENQTYDDGYDDAYPARQQQQSENQMYDDGYD